MERKNLNKVRYNTKNLRCGDQEGFSAHIKWIVAITNRNKNELELIENRFYTQLAPVDDLTIYYEDKIPGKNCYGKLICFNSRFYELKHPTKIFSADLKRDPKSLKEWEADPEVNASIYLEDMVKS